MFVELNILLVYPWIKLSPRLLFAYYSFHTFKALHTRRKNQEQWYPPPDIASLSKPPSPQGFVSLSMSLLASGQELIAPPRIESLLLDVMANIMRPSEVYAQYQKLVIRIHRGEDITQSKEQSCILNFCFSCGVRLGFVTLMTGCKKRFVDFEWVKDSSFGLLEHYDRESS